MIYIKEVKGFPKSRVEDKAQDARSLSQEEGVREQKGWGWKIANVDQTVRIPQWPGLKVLNASKNCPLESWEMSLFSHSFPMLEGCSLGVWGWGWGEAWTLPDGCAVFLRTDHRSSSFVSERHRTKCRKTSVCLETDTKVNLWAKGNAASSCIETEAQGWGDVKEAQDSNSKRLSKAVYLMLNKSIQVSGLQ